MSLGLVVHRSNAEMAIAVPCPTSSLVGRIRAAAGHHRVMARGGTVESAESVTIDDELHTSTRVCGRVDVR